jgi:outer membrane protein
MKQVLGMACALALAGCVQRSTFVPPPPPTALVRPRPTAETSLPEGPLSVGGAVQLAIARNPDLRAAADRIAQARATLDGTTGAFLPHVAADVTYLHGDAPSAYLFKRIDARRLPAQVDFNDPGTFNNVEGGVGLQWNLWNGGRDLLARWSADTAVQTTALARDAAINALVMNVVDAFLKVRAAEELLAADDASVRTVEAQVDESRVKVEGGGALRSDLLSLEVRLAEAREQRFRSETASQLARAALRELLALPQDAPITLAESSYSAGALPDTAAEALAEAYRVRPEAAMSRRAVERARIDLGSASRAYLPRVDVLSRFYADNPNLFRYDQKDPNYTVAVALSVDLFDGGTRAAAIDRASAVVDELTEADRKSLLAIAHDVEVAYLHLGEARARFRVAAQAVGAAEESLRLVDVQYRGGGATVTRFLEAEGAQSRARTARIQAALDVDRATVEAHRAIGSLFQSAANGSEEG